MELYHKKANEELDEACHIIGVSIPKDPKTGFCDYDLQMTRLFSANGIVLSGGQEQKMSVSRLINNSFGLRVFDEPTASLDPISEKELIKSIYDTSGQSTTVIVAHRLSSIVDSDQIIVMENGEIVEHGRHQELLSLENGRYSSMFRAQGEKYQL